MNEQGGLIGFSGDLAAFFSILFLHSSLQNNVLVYAIGEMHFIVCGKKTVGKTIDLPSRRGLIHFRSTDFKIKAVEDFREPLRIF